MFQHNSNIEYLHPGHMGCPGCGGALSMRHALKVLGEETIIVIPACCWSIIAGMFPTTSLAVPLLHVPFATAAACASGIKRSLEVKGKEATVMVWAGDGGTFDIGLQALSGAADRQEDILYVCYDNEAYMNTGIQQSAATPPGAWTTTTPQGKELDYPKKDIISIVLAHHPAYLATATIFFPEDFYHKFAKAKAKKGFRFIHLLSVCPPGWKIDSKDGPLVSRMAVETDVFPLLESNDQLEIKRTYCPAHPRPLSNYFNIQKRFKHLKANDLKQITQDIILRNKRLFGEHGPLDEN